jgi:hypothetical protein
VGVEPVKLYALADKLCLSSLKDEVLDVVRDCYRAHGALSIFWGIKDMYMNTTEGSPLRTYALHELLYIFSNFKDSPTFGWPTSNLRDILMGDEDLCTSDFLTVGSDVNGLIRTSLSGLLQHLQLLHFSSELDIEK